LVWPINALSTRCFWLELRLIDLLAFPLVGTDHWWTSIRELGTSSRRFIAIQSTASLSVWIWKKNENEKEREKEKGSDLKLIHNYFVESFRLWKFDPQSSKHTLRIIIFCTLGESNHITSSSYCRIGIYLHIYCWLKLLICDDVTF
jgi:hypothetical protein